MLKQILGKLFDVIYKDSLCVFLYHEVSDNPSEFNKLHDLNVSPSTFQKQIVNIGKLFNIITPEQLLSDDYRTPAALITFDDGMAGYFENAVPVMESLKCQSVMFLNMGPVDGEIFWSGLVVYLTTFDKSFQNELKDHFKGAIPPASFLYCSQELVERYLKNADRSKIYQDAREFYGGFATREHLAGVADSKYVYLGNHLYNHYNAAILSDEDLRVSYLRNQAELEKYPNSVKIFSYPFGQPESCYNDKTDALIYELGAQAIFSAYPSPDYDRKSTFFHRFAMNNNICTGDGIKYMLIKKHLLSKIRKYA